MPRDGSGIYSRPAGIDAVTDTTIESAKYNLNVQDVEADLNWPRPISSGGTGATTAAAALVNFGGEHAGQLVGNYDSFPFANGSFYSGPGATSAPNGTDFFEGTCYTVNSGIVDFYLEVRSLATDVKYLRRKGGSGWGPWVREDTDIIAAIDAKVAKAGDTMTGPLAINSTLAVGGTFTASGNVVRFNPTTTSLTYDVPSGKLVVAGAQFHVNSDLLATGAVVSGGDLLANGNVIKFNPGTVNLTYSTGTGNLVLAGAQFQINSNLIVNGTTNGSSIVLRQNGGSQVALDTLSTGQQATILFYSSGVGKWQFGKQTDDSFFIYKPGAADSAIAIDVSSNVRVPTTTASTSPNTGALTVGGGVGVSGVLSVAGGGINNWAPAGNDVTYNLVDDAGSFKGNLSWARNNNSIRIINGTAGADGAIVLDNLGNVFLSRGSAGRAGQTGAYDANTHNFYWTGSANQMWIGTANIGSVSVTCDYRIKKDVAPLRSTWEAIKALRPIVYTQAEYTPPGSKQPLFIADKVKRWGFLAHELQETLLPSAAHGSKDSPTEIQSPNLLAIVAALTKALQEAMERIEALENGGK